MSKLLGNHMQNKTKLYYDLLEIIDRNGTSIEMDVPFRPSDIELSRKKRLKSKMS